MGDMDRSINFRRSKQSTDEWYASCLDAQVRARWKAPPKDIAKKAEVGNRLAGLYGANTSSKMIRKRASKIVHSPVKAAFSSPAAKRRSLSQPKDRKGKKKSKEAFSFARIESPPKKDETGGMGWADETKTESREAGMSTLGTPSDKTRQSGVMMETVVTSTSPKKKAQRDPNNYDHVKSKLSTKPKYQRQKYKGNGFKGFYVGKGKLAPGSLGRPYGSIKRYGCQGTLNLEKLKYPAIMSPVGRTKDRYIPKALNSISRTNVYAEPFYFKPTRDWPAEAFNLASPERTHKPGDVTARDTRGLQFEEREARRVYKLAKEEQRRRRLKSQATLRSTGLDKFNADGTPRRNALKHLGSVGQLKYVLNVLFSLPLSFMAFEVSCWHESHMFCKR